MPQVTELVKRPDGTAASGVLVQIRLYAATTDTAGYVTAADTTILGKWDYRTTATGAWSATLVANSLINPAGTVYEIARVFPSRSPVVSYVTVPAGAGPYVVEDILTDAPATLASPGSIPVSAGTTKGDVLVFDGDSWNRVPVGANGQALVANSAADVGLGYSDIGTQLEVDALAASSLQPQLVVPTGGTGTAASLFTHADGSGGIATALLAAQTSGKATWVRRGHYAVTTSINGWYDGASLFFEPGVVLHPSGFAADAYIIDLQGLVGNYLENITIGSFHVDRTGQTNRAHVLNMQYVRKSQFGLVTSEGGDDSLIRPRNCELLRFDGCEAYNVGNSAGTFSALRLSNSKIGHVYSDGGDEGLDIADCSWVDVDSVYGQDGGGDVVDIGSCTDISIGRISGKNCPYGVEVKIDAGATIQECSRITIGAIDITDLGTDFVGLYVTNAAADFPVRDVHIGRLVLRGLTATKGQGVWILTKPAAVNRIARVSIDAADVIVGQLAMEVRDVDDLHVSGYVESTNTTALSFLNTQNRLDLHLTAKDVSANPVPFVIEHRASGIYGDGSDGSVTVAAGTTTLAKDMFYTDLTVQSGGILATAGFRVYVKGTCTIDTGGKIANNGNAGLANGTAGTITTRNTLDRGQTGGAGGTAAGSPGTGIATIGGSGGAGGLGSGGAGGAAGVASAPAATLGTFRHLPATLIGHMFGQSGSGILDTILTGGAGGGGGGGDGTAGGGGGGGGGPVLVAAKLLVLNGTIESKGGDGGSPAAGDRGGGGGGGGGPIVLTYAAKLGAGTLVVTGGTGGTKQGTGVNGSNGAGGATREVVAQ